MHPVPAGLKWLLSWELISPTQRELSVVLCELIHMIYHRAELCKDPHDIKEKIIFLTMLPQVGSGHNDPKIRRIWVPECSSKPPSLSQHFSLTNTFLWFRGRNENFPQTCCEKSKEWEGGKTLKLSWLTLTLYVQGAFVTSWCTSSVVLYTPVLHRGHMLRAHYTTLKTMTKIHYVQETFSRRCAGSICLVQ